MKLLSVNKRQLARDLGVAVVRGGLNGGWAGVFVGVIYHWTWPGIAAVVALSALTCGLGFLTAMWGCLKELGSPPESTAD